MTILLIYVVIFIVAYFAVKFVNSRLEARHDFTSLKTVTFGDESAVTPNRAASVISVLAIFLIWGAFTGSKLVPIHAPGPFAGDASFTYTVEAEDGQTDDATVQVRVFRVGDTVMAPEIEPGDGFAKNDADTVGAWRSKLIRVDANDDLGRSENARVIAVDGQPIAPGEEVKVASGIVAMTPKGTLNFKPAQGWQMEPIWLPAPEAVWGRIVEISREGYQNSTLLEHLGLVAVPRGRGLFLWRAGRHSAGLRDGPVELVSRLVRPDRGIHAPGAAACADPAGHHLGRYR